ncbi:MAG TPA: hypothetical protein VHQ03_09405, partial [Candidatus Dormibacteraeota bacterium]|nr:hypothetical protein [Candidatus Dormibacteraeota bacterium]
SAQKAVGFGPIDFIPDSWLPDGRIVADHSCLIPQMGGGPCDSSLDGTYIFTADGASRTLFFKLAPGVRVVGYI